MKIDIRQVKTIGQGLLRPEGVMAQDDGSVLTADGRGHCARIAPDGQTTFSATSVAYPTAFALIRKANASSPISATVKFNRFHLPAPIGF